MSRFSEKHPKLSVAFKGAAQRMKDPLRLVSSVATLAAFSAASIVVTGGTALVPVFAVGILSGLIGDGCVGGRNALRASKRNKPAPRV